MGADLDSRALRKFPPGRARLRGKRTNVEGVVMISGAYAAYAVAMAGLLLHFTTGLPTTLNSIEPKRWTFSVASRGPRGIEHHCRG
jgi:hypothetical protein